MQAISMRLETLGDNELDAAIVYCAARSHNPETRGRMVNLRREKLRRQFVEKMIDRIRQDPDLAATTTVTIT